MKIKCLNCLNHEKKMKQETEEKKRKRFNRFGKHIVSMLNEDDDMFARYVALVAIHHDHFKDILMEYIFINQPNKTTVITKKPK